MFTKVKYSNFYVKNSFTVIIFPRALQSFAFWRFDVTKYNPSNPDLKFVPHLRWRLAGPARFAHFAELSASFAVCLYTLLIGVFMIATQPIKCFTLATLTPLALTRSGT